ncbi:MAG TPA: CARDB domain-containing protein [Gemmatimonadales bacterium]|nr:CARDB domain-containing protein [Gemmatimonadales bacterium]
MSHPRRDRRRLAFALLVALCVGGGGAYTAWAAFRNRSGGGPAAGPLVAVGDAAAGRALIGRSRPTVMFRNGVEGQGWGQVALVSTAAPDEPRTIVPLRCQRLHFAAGRGLCIIGKPGVVSSYDAYTFGPNFTIGHRFPLSGVPTRSRVSPDGRYGAVTVFLSGHSYADASFSTKTILIDLVTGVELGNLEEFAVLRDGQPFKAVDFNFWGVTFTPDGNRFYATLRTGGQTYLVEGGIAARAVHVVRANVECPSLSPDGTRLAFKKLVGAVMGVPVWRFHVLDLGTMTETPLAEMRSVDDQVEWLDDRHVLYEIAPDLWTVPADGSGEPRRFMRSALSPAVVRTAFAPPPTKTRTVVLPSADVGVTMSAAPNPVRVGQNLTYTITVSNHGPAVVNELGIAVRLSGAVTFGAIEQKNPTGTPYGCTFQDGYVSCTVSQLAGGAMWTVAFTVIPNQAGLVRQRVIVDAAQPDPAPGNNSATVETTVIAP